MQATSLSIYQDTKPLKLWDTASRFCWTQTSRAQHLMAIGCICCALLKMSSMKCHQAFHQHFCWQDSKMTSDRLYKTGRPLNQMASVAFPQHLLCLNITDCLAEARRFPATVNRHTARDLMEAKLTKANPSWYTTYTELSLYIVIYADKSAELWGFNM